MKFKFTEGEKNTMVMEVEIPYEELAVPMKQKTKEYAQKVNIPGFRKGKAPAQVIESFVGLENIMTEAVESLISAKYIDELKNQEFEPIAAPKLETVQLEKNKDIIMKGIIPIKPPVKLGQYMGLEVTKRVYTVGEEDVKQEISTNLSRIAKLVAAPVDTLTANGQVVNLDFSGSVDGQLFEGGSAEDYPLQLGAGAFIPGFEEQLIGLKIGDSKDVIVTFPENYGEALLAGKEAVFHCRINSIRFKDLPELTDDMVKDLSETADTVADWKEELRKKLQDEADESAENELRNNLLGKAVEAVEVEIPMLMTEPRVNQMYEDLSQRLEDQELDIKDYLKYMKTDLFGLRKQFRVQAENDAKVEMMLEAIAKKEKLEATPEELEKEITELAEYNMQPFEDYKKQLINNNQISYVLDKILMEKAAQFIYDNAKITVQNFDSESVKTMMAEQATEKPKVQSVDEDLKKPVKKAAAKTSAVISEETAEETPVKKKAAPKKKSEVKNE